MKQNLRFKKKDIPSHKSKYLFRILSKAPENNCHNFNHLISDTNTSLSATQQRRNMKARGWVKEVFSGSEKMNSEVGITCQIGGYPLWK